jgi:hypothetical protein
MKILIACESSGTVREAFRKLGHDAWSCDLLPADDGSPYHFQQDCLRVIRGGRIVADRSPCPLWPAFVTGANCATNGDQMDAMDPRTQEWCPYPADDVSAAFLWDLVIAHPPCTHLASAGAKHFAAKRADGRQQQGIDLFMAIVSECQGFARRWAVENPIGIMSRVYRKPDQIIQPYWFGDSARKSTCLWLGNLRPLTPTNVVDQGEDHITKSGRKLPKWYNIPPSNPDRWKIRSKTFQGIADAMAQQWGTE